MDSDDDYDNLNADRITGVESPAVITAQTETMGTHTWHANVEMPNMLMARKCKYSTIIIVYTWN